MYCIVSPYIFRYYNFVDIYFEFVKLIDANFYLTIVLFQFMQVLNADIDFIFNTDMNFILFSIFSFTCIHAISAT